VSTVTTAIFFSFFIGSFSIIAAGNKKSEGMKYVIFHKINLGLLQRYCFKRTANALLKYSEVLFI
jgi:hypothetical protein